MSSFKERLPTALLFGSAMIFGIIYSPVSFFIVFLTILIVGIWEFYQLFENPSHKSTKAFGIILGIIIYSMFFLDAMNGLQPKVFTLLIPLFFLMFFFSSRHISPLWFDYHINLVSKCTWFYSNLKEYTNQA